MARKARHVPQSLIFIDSLGQELKGPSKEGWLQTLLLMERRGTWRRGAWREAAAMELTSQSSQSAGHQILQLNAASCRFLDFRPGFLRSRPCMNSTAHFGLHRAIHERLWPWPCRCKAQFLPTNKCSLKPFEGESLIMIVSWQDVTRAPSSQSLKNRCWIS